jgi:hypothetical protein
MDFSHLIPSPQLDDDDGEADATSQVKLHPKPLLASSGSETRE